MKKLLLFCSLFIGLSSNAQVNFLNNTIMDGKGCFGEINKVIPLDIDNDGDFDMISSAESGLIGWHENLDGLGNFGPLHVIYGGYFGITSMYLADINNDGEMDIIISSKENGRIAWYENIGQGNFVEHELITDLTGANDVKAADIDGDGYLDIVANTNQGSIGWFKNTNGLGDFSTIYPISTGLAVITSIDVQDVDGDGDIDIVANSTQFNQFIRVGIYRNLNGLGNFGTFQLITSVSPEPNYSIVSTLLFEDLDNDGDYDIIFSANNQLLTLTNNGQGNFSTINTIFSSYIRDRIRAVNVTDMDYDGDLDIVMAMTTTTLDGYDKVMWYENDSTHSYTTSHIAQFFRKNDIRTFMIVDLDGDALHDMITGSRFGDVLVRYKDYTSLRALGKICFSPRRMQMVDLDNDGDLDFIMFAGLNKLVWYENIDGSGTAGLQKIITFKDGTPGYSTGDINGDGFIDIVIDQKWFKNDGLGNFTEMIFVTESANQSSNY